MRGNWGRVLKVDLSSGDCEEWPVAEGLYRDFLGGSGLAAWLFFVLRGHEADPLSPRNPLFFMTGPLAAANFPGSSRLEICARSPLTGIWGEASMGGQAAPDLKGTGYDGLVVTGAAESPVYIYLTEKGAELRDASHLWGKDTFETEELIRGELGERKARVMAIGPAGENLVPYAGVVHDRGSLAARSGMGAVMGSKRLKAVAVRGKAGCGVADAEACARVREEALASIKKSVFAEGLHLYGTAGGVDLSSAICDMPVKNWRRAQWKEGMESLSGVRMAETILARRRSCRGCPVACKRLVEIPSGKYAMPEGPGPEYEGVGALGFLLGIDDLEAVARANALCNAYGLDAISTGGTIAYAVEAYQAGLISQEDTGGLVLDWNRPDLLLELVGMIARREGFGEELARGCRAMAARYGGEEFAIQVKGMECPMHDPRALWSMSLSYATSIRGGCHNRDTNLGLEMGMDDLEEIGFARTRPQRAERKAMQNIHSQAIGAVCDAAVMCVFAWKGTGSTLRVLADMVNAVTGYGLSVEELLKTGNRIWYLKRAIGNLCGMGREDDQVPRRIITPHEEGEATDFLRVLNPLIRVNNWLAERIRGEKAQERLMDFHARFVLPNTYRTITVLGKLLPSPRRGMARLRRAEALRAGGSRVDFERMLDDFYRLRRIDERGRPAAEVLEEMGLGEVARELFATASSETVD